ncbi:MAG: chromosomal replication initiator protein DnaA [Deltaproteobacteria bacterium]|jgi:chromosomal replication initiator protein|nr:chromosomal replication initiator protein DnaA [Deltaproteobacteria bacterium]
MVTNENVPEMDFRGIGGPASEADDQRSDVLEDRSVDPNPPLVSEEAPPLTDIWEAVKEELSKTVNAMDFKGWIQPIKAQSKGQSLVLVSPNKFSLDWVQDNYLATITELVRPIRSDISVELILDPKAPSAPAPKPQPKPAAQRESRRSLTPLRLNPNFSFEEFIPGDPNRLPFEASQGFARGDNLGADILLLSADHGLGKTHLIQAAAQKFRALNPGKVIFYLSAEQYTSELVSSLKRHNIEDFKNKYRNSCDFFLVEEICFLCGKAKFQEEFNYTLDLLLNHGKKIILTSSKDLRDMNHLCPPLKSKLLAALRTPINPPDFETRVAILAHKAQKSGLRLERPVVELLAEKLLNDVRLLEGCLITISATSRYLRRPVNIELARQCLGQVQESTNNELTLDRIIKLVCQNFHLEEAKLTSSSRRKSENEARSLGMYLARCLTDKTFTEIGAAFNRSHSSTMRSINQVTERLTRDQKLKDKIDFITGQLIQN